MKTLKFLDTVFEAVAKAIGVTIVAGLVWRLLTASQPPASTLLSITAICAVMFYATNAIKRELARIQCELTGHWHAEFKKKYDDEAHCPRCKELIRTKAPESDGPGMQFGEDTLHQRLARLEVALGVKE